MVTKVITKRLSMILVERSILKGANFVALLGTSTEYPIQLMNTILEEAKEKLKKIWVLFQDMRKVFDSVSHEMLELALQRIKVPKRTIQFIINLFESKKFRVITGVGFFKAITVEDGIDQGKVISL